MKTGQCSRCEKALEITHAAGGFSCGYYVAAGWEKFCNPGDVYVCDTCMWKDPRYIYVYGETDV